MHPDGNPTIEHQVADFHHRLTAITTEHAQALQTATTSAFWRNGDDHQHLRRLPHQVFQWVVSRLGHRLTPQQEQDSAPDPGAASPVIIDAPYRVISTETLSHPSLEDK
jgi:hypothetical protein